MLLIDGVKYELWKPESEDAFEQVVKEHVQDIFGENSIYLDTKQKLKSKAGIGSIPDGYAIVFNSPPCWHIVEMELSNHPIYDHVITQISKFINGVKNHSTQREIVNIIYGLIDDDDYLKLKVKKSIGPSETYRFLSELVSKPPELTVVIEQRTETLDEALSCLANLRFHVVEFQTFARQGVGLPVHTHLFEPLYTVIPPKPSLPAQIPPQKVIPPRKRVKIQDLVNAGIIGLGQRLFNTYKGNQYEAEIITEGKIKLIHDQTTWNSLSSASDLYYKHIN